MKKGRKIGIKKSEEIANLIRNEHHDRIHSVEEAEKCVDKIEISFPNTIVLYVFMGIGR